jgi:hypothetical protein
MKLPLPACRSRNTQAAPEKPRTSPISFSGVMRSPARKKWARKRRKNGCRFVSRAPREALVMVNPT